MSEANLNDNNNKEIANLWGSSWHKLTARQKQLVSDTLNKLNVSNFSNLEEKVDRMPLPDFGVAESTIFPEPLKIQPLTINWQFVLANISEALIKPKQSNLIYLLFAETDYLQLNRNAITDTCSMINQPCNVTVLGEIEAQIGLIKEYISESKNRNLRDRIINEYGILLEQLKKLETAGIAAFMLAASVKLLLLQEKASDCQEWVNIKNQVIEYINYAKSVNPQLFRLTVGQIDKTCKCRKYKSEHEEITEYECRYFDGRNIHVFREFNHHVGYECNKHRLKMFQSVVETVNQTVSSPVRSALKKWQEFASQIPPC